MFICLVVKEVRVSGKSSEKGFEDIKQIFESHNSMYNRQYNDQRPMKKDKKNNPQNIKTKNNGVKILHGK